jgi:replication-associated recombination protein RarA
MKIARSPLRISSFGDHLGERVDLSADLLFLMPFRCGKTTMARLLGGCADAVFREVSATIASAVEVRSIFEEARNELQLTGRFVVMNCY